MAIPISSVSPTLSTPVINRLDPSSPGYIPPAELQTTLNELNPVSGSASAQTLVDTLEVVNDVRPFVSELSTSTNNLLGELNDQLNTLRVLDGLPQPGNALLDDALGADGLIQNLAQPAELSANNLLNPDTPAFAAITPDQPQSALLTPGLTTDPLTGEQLTSAPVTSFDPADTNLDGNVSPQEDFEFSQQNPIADTTASTPTADTITDTNSDVIAEGNIALLQGSDAANAGTLLDNGSLTAQGILNQQAAERQAALLDNTYGPNQGGEQTSSGGILSLAA